MKKISTYFIAILLLVTMLAGCGAGADTNTPETLPDDAVIAAAPEVIPEATPESSEDGGAYEGDTFTHYTDTVYPQQIERYYTALSEKWEEGMYFDNGLSHLPFYYYEGNPLENVGYTFIDLDNDGSMELIIGAILNSEKDPAVFEIWTLVDGESHMLAQGSSRNRYILQYAEDDGMWYIVNEASNSAFNSATYYLMLNEGKFEVVQGVILDAFANEENPWFLTYDMDWDTSNDEPTDEATANAIFESNRKLYTVPEYLPYSSY